MRCLPKVLTARPNARVIIVGGDDVSYGARLPDGQTFRQKMLAELDRLLDLSRVHFLGKIPYTGFIKVLQISRVHVYLTYPFVLSWSMLEAMAAGCLVVGRAHNRLRRSSTTAVMACSLISSPPIRSLTG